MTMQCLVKLPNDVIFEIELDIKSKGQECLDQVCERLGIIEVDYFGLQYHGQNGELLWLNLRNPVKQQMPGDKSPLRLLLKVKFYVPLHLVLQESTRDQLYLNLLRDLQDGSIDINDKDKTVRLAALVAQTEVGDAISINSAFNANIYCNYLPLSLIEVETDVMALNDSPSTFRRTRRVSSPPCLRNAQSSLRYRRTRSTGPSRTETTEDAILSLFHSIPAAPSVTGSFKKTGSEVSEICLLVREHHVSLKGMKKSHAKYLFLKEMSLLEDYGLEKFSVKTISGNDELLELGVGPKGVSIIFDTPYSVDNENNSFPYALSKRKVSIPYSSMHVVTNPGRNICLTFIDESGKSHPLDFKCDTTIAAHAIYRAITEKHAFYSCETVCKEVTSQFIRDLKGTIFSLFNENTPLGKIFVFDIKRTCREVYDHTRRVLYQLENKKTAIDDEEVNVTDAGIESNLSMTQSRDHVSKIICNQTPCTETKKRLTMLENSLLCRVCMDCDVTTVFFPCRHMPCCSDCSLLCDSCPLCRTNVESRERIFLPISSSRTSSGNSEETLNIQTEVLP